MLYFGSKISENIQRREPEGYLYCLNVPIARVGKQKYLGREIGLSIDGVVDVDRPASEVFAKEAMASFEGMPVTDDHPSERVTTQNHGAYARGHVQNVRMGAGIDEGLLLADLVITDSGVIEQVLNGKRDVSCGYECDYLEDEKGRLYQANIRGNHVAIVDDGRAGRKVAIRDAQSVQTIDNKDKKERMKKRMSVKKPSLWARAMTAFIKDSSNDIEEAAEAMDEFIEQQKATEQKPEAAEEKPAEEKVVVDEGDEVLAGLLKELIVEIQSLKAQRLAAADEEKEKIEVGEHPDVEVKEQPKEEEAVDALTELEKELEGDETKEQLEAEEKLTVPPEDIKVKDEDEQENLFVEKPEEDEAVLSEEEEAEKAKAVNSVLRDAINELKPIIAGLPSKEKKQAADACTRALRKHLKKGGGMTADSTARLAMIASGRKVRDGKQSEADIGKIIMQSRNPHYKKKDA